MSVRVNSRLQGIPEMQRAFDELGAALTKDVQETAMIAAAKPTVERARALAPRSGDAKGKPLAESIVARRTISRRQLRLIGGKPSGAFVAVGPTAPHGHLLEFGHAVKVSRGPRRGQAPAKGKTQFVGPRPFLRPAWEATRSGFGRLLIREIQPAIQKVLRKLNRQVTTGRLSRKTRQAVQQ